MNIRYALALFIIVVLAAGWAFTLTGNLIAGGGHDSPSGSGLVEVTVIRPNATDMVVLLIAGERFPLSQFRVFEDSSCTEPHYHADVAYSLTGSRATDPDPEGCGFGSVESLALERVTISDEEYLTFLSLRRNQ